MALAYNFEPKKRLEDSKEKMPQKKPDMHDTDRIGNIRWCGCGLCVAMPTPTECLCCAEVEGVRTKLAECLTPTICITQHSRFSTVCLQPDVLQSVMVLLHDVQCSQLVL